MFWLKKYFRWLWFGKKEGIDNRNAEGIKASDRGIVSRSARVLVRSPKVQATFVVFHDLVDRGLIRLNRQSRYVPGCGCPLNSNHQK